MRYEARTGGAPLTGAERGPDHDARDRMRHPAFRAAFTLVVAIAAALVLAGCGAGGGGSSAGGDSGEADPSGGGESGGESVKLGVPSLGREDAPVVMTEYSDYQ
jgi:hypothetical protein